MQGRLAHGKCEELVFVIRINSSFCCTIPDFFLGVQTNIAEVDVRIICIAITQNCRKPQQMSRVVWLKSF